MKEEAEVEKITTLGKLFTLLCLCHQAV